MVALLIIMLAATGTNGDCSGQTAHLVTDLPSMSWPLGLGSWDQLAIFSSVFAPRGGSGQDVPRKGAGQNGMSQGGLVPRAAAVQDPICPAR